MAGTTISELGKMFNQSTQSVQGTESNTRITTGKVDFGSMMKQSGNRQTASYAGIDHNETVKTAANGSKDTVKAADDYGYVVAAHAHGTEGIRRAVLGGVHSIEHGTFLTDEVMELMIENSY